MRTARKMHEHASAFINIVNSWKEKFYTMNMAQRHKNRSAVQNDQRKKTKNKNEREINRNSRLNYVKINKKHNHEANDGPKWVAKHGHNSRIRMKITITADGW